MFRNPPGVCTFETGIVIHTTQPPFHVFDVSDLSRGSRAMLFLHVVTKLLIKCKAQPSLELCWCDGCCLLGNHDMPGLLDSFLAPLTFG